jgi:hypothetical protein
MSLLDTENPRLVATIITETIATTFVVGTLLSAASDAALLMRLSKATATGASDICAPGGI